VEASFFFKKNYYYKEEVRMQDFRRRILLPVELLAHCQNVNWFIPCQSTMRVGLNYTDRELLTSEGLKQHGPTRKIFPWDKSAGWNYSVHGSKSLPAPKILGVTIGLHRHSKLTAICFVYMMISCVTPIFFLSSRKCSSSFTCYSSFQLAISGYFRKILRENEEKQ
jgi:hypothetical protein